MEHFRLEQVADDAWAAVALPDSGGNGGFIRVGGYTIVFDTFASTAAADEVRISAELIRAGGVHDQQPLARRPCQRQQVVRRRPNRCDRASRAS